MLPVKYRRCKNLKTKEKEVSHRRCPRCPRLRWWSLTSRAHHDRVPESVSKSCCSCAGVTSRRRRPHAPHSKGTRVTSYGKEKSYGRFTPHLLAACEPVPCFQRTIVTTAVAHAVLGTHPTKLTRKGPALVKVDESRNEGDDAAAGGRLAPVASVLALHLISCQETRTGVGVCTPLGTPPVKGASGITRPL